MVRARVSTALAHEQTLKGGGTLQLLEHTVPLDAARDDDSRGDVKSLVREFDPLGRLRALELVDLKRVTVDPAKGEACHVPMGVGTKVDTLRGRWYTSAP